MRLLKPYNPDSLSLSVDQIGLKLLRSACFYLLTAGIKDRYHHCPDNSASLYDITITPHNTTEVETKPLPHKPKDKGGQQSFRHILHRNNLTKGALVSSNCIETLLKTTTKS